MAGLSRKKDYGSKKKPYPKVKSQDFAGKNRKYPIPTKADARDALRLAGLHGRSDVKAKVYKKYPSLKKHQEGGPVNGGPKKYSPEYDYNSLFEKRVLDLYFGPDEDLPVSGKELAKELYKERYGKYPSKNYFDKLLS